MWALGIVIPALLLVFFSWQIIKKAPQEGAEALKGGRVITLLLPPAGQGSAAQPIPTPPIAGKAGQPAAPSAPSQPQTAAPVIPPPGEGLKTAPDERLTENTPLGPLPKIAADGTKAWLYYARPSTYTGSGPAIAIIITGLGMARGTSDQALHLPPDVSLSFSPYAPDAPVWVGAARATGHEVLVDIPFEPKDYPAVDPGPYGLLSGQGEEANEQNLRWVLTRFAGYVGGLAPASEHFTNNGEAARPILQFMAGHGLMLDLGASSLPEQATSMLEHAGLPFLHADIRVEAGMTRDEITTQLLAAERVAQTHGHALIVVDASPVTLKEVAGWAELLGQKRIILIPVSALARLKFS
jgi:polysaccharide deacetylase 2 family uncharacterized protein YibQ